MNRSAIVQAIEGVLQQHVVRGLDGELQELLYTNDLPVVTSRLELNVVQSLGHS